MGDPTFPFIGNAIKLVEFSYRVSEVTEENRVFISLIHRVQLDLDKVCRLIVLPNISNYLQDHPEEKAYTDRIIHDTKSALNDIGKYVEDVRVDKESRKGPVKLWHKIIWVFNNHEKLVSQERRLDACHRSLAANIVTLSHHDTSSNLTAQILSEVRVNGPAPPTYDSVGRRWEDPTGGEALKPPMLRRRARSTVGNDTTSLIDLDYSEPSGSTHQPFRTSIVDHPSPPVVDGFHLPTPVSSVPITESCRSPDNYFGTLSPRSSISTTMSSPMTPPTLSSISGSRMATSVTRRDSKTISNSIPPPNFGNSSAPLSPRCDSKIAERAELPDEDFLAAFENFGGLPYMPRSPSNATTVSRFSSTSSKYGSAPPQSPPPRPFSTISELDSVSSERDRSSFGAPPGYPASRPKSVSSFSATSELESPSSTTTSTRPSACIGEDWNKQSYIPPSTEKIALSPSPSQVPPISRTSTTYPQPNMSMRWDGISGTVSLSAPPPPQPPQRVLTADRRRRSQMARMESMYGKG